MHRIRMELFHNKTQNSSPQHLQKQSPLRNFTPFQKERDAMNRLIRPSVHQSQQLKEPQKKRNSENEDENLKETAMNRKIHEIFKQQNIFADGQPKKRKIGKKTLIQILSEDSKKVKTTDQKMQSIQLIKKGSADSAHSNRFSKTHSLQLYRPNSQSQVGIKKMNSTIGFRQYSTASSQKKDSSNSPQFSPKKTVYYEPAVNVEQNLNKYPQLNRYRRMKELQVKLHKDIEQTHDRFIGKMMHSKQLAYEVKINLDKIGYY